MGSVEDGEFAAELPPPVTQLLLQHFALQPLALPDGEVGVLDGQLFERRGLAPQARRVERGEVAEEDADRPAIADDVMRRDEQDVFPRAEAEQTRARERGAREVERPARFLDGEAHGLRLAPRLGQPGEVCHLKGERREVVDELHGPIAVNRKAGAQRLVAADDFIETALKGGHVEVAAEAQRLGDVIERAVEREAVYEPEALLREGEGEGARAVPRRRADRGQLSGRGGSRPGRDFVVGRDGRGRLLPRADARRRVRVLFAEVFAKGGDIGRVEKRDDGDYRAEALLESVDEDGGVDRVAAEVEEVVVDADLLDAEDGAPHLAQHLLKRRARRDVGLL